MIIERDEEYILRINLYSGQEILLKVGWEDDMFCTAGRVEFFEIAADERLIGVMQHCLAKNEDI